MSELIKTCNKCNLGKDAGTCFDKRLNSRDGYRQTCKTCRSEQSRGYRGRNKERTVIDVPLEKICLKCGEKKDNALFYKNKGKTDGLGSYCKICSDKSIKSWGDKNRVRKTRGQNRWAKTHQESVLASKLKWDKANPGYDADWRKRNPQAMTRFHLMKSYGLTLEQYEEMLGIQGGRCAICGGDSGAKGKKHAVDHDHVTGKVRGLLCVGCNGGLGRVNDSVERLKDLVSFLGMIDLFEYDVFDRPPEVCFRSLRKKYFVHHLKIKPKNRRRVLEAQYNRCSVCCLEFSKNRRPVVDHCHVTGRVRGFLCGACNTALGQFKDSPEIINKAIAYLEKHK